MSLSLAFAQAQSTECLNTTTVETTGYGITGQNSDEQFEQALASALASAITQVRGVYINAETELIEVVRESVTESGYSSTANTEFREEVSERFSGFITQYNLLERTTDESGIAAVSISADVCTDARIALNFVDSAVTAAFAGELAANIGNLGWQILSVSATSESSGSLLEVGLQTGASYIAQGQIQLSPMSSSDRAISYTASIDVSLVDVRTLEAINTLSFTENGIGYSEAEAVQDAVSKLAVTVARSWTQQFLAPEQRLVSTIVVSRVSRSGTRYTLEEMVKQLSGVINVVSAEYDEAAQAVNLSIELSSDLCGVANELAEERRILMQVETCSNGLAELYAIRE